MALSDMIFLHPHQSNVFVQTHLYTKMFDVYFVYCWQISPIQIIQRSWAYYFWFVCICATLNLVIIFELNKMQILFELSENWIIWFLKACFSNNCNITLILLQVPVFLNFFLNIIDKILENTVLYITCIKINKVGIEDSSFDRNLEEVWENYC